MPLNWLPSVDKYISEWYMWTDEELDDIAIFESQWRRTIHKQSFASLLEDFPQAKPMMRQYLKDVVAACEADLREAVRLRTEYEKRAQDWTRNPKMEWFPEMVNEILFVQPLTEGRLKTIKEAKYYLSLITNKISPDEKEAVNSRGVTKTQIERARAVDIRSLVLVNEKNKALCVFHKEMHPSMQVFKDNHVHCFSCSGHGSAIDVYKALHDCGFVTAVKNLT